MSAGYNHYFNSFDLFGLLGLDANALSQVNKIGPLNISFIQWSYLSQLNQSLNTTNNVIFNSITGDIITDSITELTPGHGVDIELANITDDTLLINHINELTLGHGVDIELANITDDVLKINTINEITLNSGVAIDGVLCKDNNVVADNIENTIMTGFHAWTGVAVTYWTIVGDQFTLDKTATGYIKSVPVTCAAAQTVTLTINDTNLIYFDSTGALSITNSIDRALYQNNVAIGKVFYDGTTTFFVKENHPYDFQTSVSNFLHETVGSVIQDGGGNLTYKSATECKIVGDCFINDHGLITEMLETDADPITFKFMFLDATGEWEMKSNTSTIPFYYNPAGTPIALTTAAKWGVYRVYAMLDSLNDTKPTFIAVINNTEYSNETAVTNAIGAGSVAAVTKYLLDMEPVSLGFIIFKNAGVQSVVIQKSTINERYTGSSTDSHLLLNDLNGSAYLTGGHSYLCQRHEAIIDPTVNDDSQTYLIGAIWINTVLGKQWICINNTVANAVWKLFLVSATNQYTDHLDELTLNHGVAIDGALIKDLALNINHIDESTLNHGVVVEGVEFKDSALATNQSNIKIGTSANCVSTSISIGYESGAGGIWTSGAVYNTLVGYRSMYNGTSGSYNVCVGHQNLATTTTGTVNVSLGYLNDVIANNDNYTIGIGINNKVESESIGIGTNNYTGARSIVLGWECGNTVGATATGTHCLSIGYAALHSLTSGTTNLAIGVNSLYWCTTGTYNIGIGSSAIAGLTATKVTGDYNVGIGRLALSTTGSGYRNVGIGFECGKAITTGHNNVFLGNAAYAVTTGYYNVIIGALAGPAIVSGISNTIIGTQTCTATTGSFNTCLGYGCNIGVGLSDCIAIGDSSICTGANAIAIGNTVTATAGDFIVGGGPSKTFLPCRAASVAGVPLEYFVGELVADACSERFKKNIRNIDVADTDWIYDLEVKKYESIDDDSTQIGIIAEDLNLIKPELVCWESNKSKVHKKNDDEPEIKQIVGWAKLKMIEILLVEVQRLNKRVLALEEKSG